MKWLSQDGPTGLKHRGIFHPIIVWTIHYAVSSFVVIYIHDNYCVLRRPLQRQLLPQQVVVVQVPQNDNDHILLQDQREEREDIQFLLLLLSKRQRTVAKFLTLYIACYFGFRLKIHHQQQQQLQQQQQQQQQQHDQEASTSFVAWTVEFYRQTFLCSGTLVLSCVGFWTGRPIIASAHIVAVGIDQLLWYVDLLGYFLFAKGTFIIGCTRYLFWDGTTWSSRLTSTHHLWTIPLVLWACRGIDILALPLSFVVVTTNVLLSRWLTPIRIDFPPVTEDKQTSKTSQQENNNNSKNSSSKINDDQSPSSSPPPPQPTSLYLNLNLAHELWSDIPFKFLRYGEESVPYLVRLLVVWFLCNILVYGLLSFISWTIFGGATPSTPHCVMIDTKNDLSYQCANNNEM